MNFYFGTSTSATHTQHTILRIDIVNELSRVRTTDCECKCMRISASAFFIVIDGAFRRNMQSVNVL